MKQLITSLFISILLLSCQPEGRVFIEHQELSPELEWLKDDVRSFKVPVEDNNKSYDMSLSFRFANGYQYELARVSVTEISPSGTETIKEYELTVRHADGSYKGEPGYDIWDSEHVIETNKTYSKKGTYTYKIKHIMPVDALNFAMEIGVILDEVK